MTIAQIYTYIYIRWGNAVMIGKAEPFPWFTKLRTRKKFFCFSQLKIGNIAFLFFEIFVFFFFAFVM